MSSAKNAKLLKDIEKVSGKDGEDAEEFLESLDEKVLESRMWDAVILGAVSNVHQGEARRWWRTIREDLGGSQVSVPSYICEYDEQYLWANLYSHTQADKEAITPRKYLALLAHRNLHPTYRNAFGEKVVMTIEDLQSWGLQYERSLQKQNKRWSAPQSADKMHITYAAPRKQASTRKTAVAASVSGEVAAATWARRPLHHNSSSSDRNSTRHPYSSRLQMRAERAVTKAAKGKRKAKTRRASRTRRVCKLLRV